MNTLYNNLVKSFSDSDWKSVKWYRDEIRAFSELSEVRNEIKENNGDAKLKEFDEELKKIKKQGKIKTALAILAALAGVGLIAGQGHAIDMNTSELNRLKHNTRSNDIELAKHIYNMKNKYDNRTGIDDKIEFIGDENKARYLGPESDEIKLKGYLGESTYLRR